MIGRALSLWLGFVAAAVLNGALRQVVLIPRLGEEVGHVASSVVLSAAILVATWLALPWLQLTSRRDAWLVGTAWVALTLAFEFVAGHYLFGAPWAKLAADYNLAQGRVWILVLLATGLAPVAAFGARRR